MGSTMKQIIVDGVYLIYHQKKTSHTMIVYTLFLAILVDVTWSSYVDYDIWDPVLFIDMDSLPKLEPLTIDNEMDYVKKNKLKIEKEMKLHGRGRMEIIAQDPNFIDVVTYEKEPRKKS